MRKLLIQNMRFFMTSDIPDPTEEELRAYFEDNIERFETEPTITYDYVYFSNPDAVPADTLDVLRAGHRQIIADTSMSHPFVEKLVRTLRQEFLVQLIT